MSGFVNFIKRNYFILALLILFIAIDSSITQWDPVNKYPQFRKNDFAKIRHFHPEKVWPAVFFGSSPVIAAYNEKISDSGLINMGITYGKIVYLEKILSRDLIHITDKIVIGVNFFTFMDNLKTDPSYIWHKKPYEPYLYFYRTELKDYLDKNSRALINGQPINAVEGNPYAFQSNPQLLSREELDKKVQEYEEKYKNLQLKDFGGNIKSLGNVIKFCKEKNIGLKLIWLPWNPVYKPPAYVDELKAEVNGILKSQNIEYLDWSDKYSAENFYDFGHLNSRLGAPRFTKEIDEWLKK